MLISVVVPAFNEQDNLRELCGNLVATIATLNVDYEIIIVDDGSTDRTLEVLKDLHCANSRVQYLSLSRNFGHQAALIAGMDYACGDVVICMDADLQHPPALIPEMLKLWESGYQVVYTIKRESNAIPLRRRLGMRLGYAVLRRVSGLKLGFGQSDFRLLDRRVVNELCQLPERDKFLRGLIGWVGFKQIGIQYDVSPRFAGSTKYGFRRLLRLVTSGVFAFTVFPLHLLTAVGIIVSLSSFLYGIIAVSLGIYALITGYSEAVPPGWASVAASISFLGGIELIAIGLVGEYVGRIYDEVKHRPLYILNQSSLGRSGPLPAPPEGAERLTATLMTGSRPPSDN